MNNSSNPSTSRTNVQIKLTSADHGFDDYDLEGPIGVHRICIPHGIKRGDNFNVYFESGTKRCANWQGGIENSLAKFFGIDIDLQVATPLTS